MNDNNKVGNFMIALVVLDRSPMVHMQHLETLMEAHLVAYPLPDGDWSLWKNKVTGECGRQSWEYIQQLTQVELERA